LSFINLILDCLFPRICPVCSKIVEDRGKLICEKCRDRLSYVKEPWCMKCGKPLRDDAEEFCSDCIKGGHSYEEGRSVFVYDDVMRFSIYNFKYHGRAEYAKFYASEIYRQLEGKIKKWNADAIIPIPLHKSKQKTRGYNQAYLIAKELSNLTNIPVYKNYLIRAKKTEVQKNLSSVKRAQNLKNAFKINENGVKLQSTILIDDIYTTGATIEAATQVLKASGVEKVYFVTVSIGRG